MRTNRNLGLRVAFKQGRYQGAGLDVTLRWNFIGHNRSGGSTGRSRSARSNRLTLRYGRRQLARLPFPEPDESPGRLAAGRHLQ